MSGCERGASGSRGDSEKAGKDERGGTIAGRYGGQWGVVRIRKI